MSLGRRGFLRDNLFLVAAVALPLVVAGFFVLATLIPRWSVPAPAYDLVLRAAATYDNTNAKVAVDYSVRNGRVEATVRPAPANIYNQPWTLFLFEHETMTVREVPIDLPRSLAEGESRTLVVEALAGRRVVTDAVAPDGYELVMRSSGSGGLVGDLFGMGRYRQEIGLMNGGRLVPLDLPAPYSSPYSATAYAVGWVVDERR